MIQESQEILSEVTKTQMVAADTLITELDRGLEGYERDKNLIKMMQAIQRQIAAVATIVRTERRLIKKGKAEY
jgi:hypothetical protein